MSFSDSQTVELRALVPPEFGSQCAMCGAWKGQLPWQAEMGGFWGPVCGSCGKRLLTRVLRRKLPKSFLESQFVDAVCSFGVERKEAQLMLGDFMKERSILETPAGLFWRESSEVIEPLVTGANRKRRRGYRRPSPEEIFRRALMLSREILERGKFSPLQTQPQAIPTELARRKRTEWL
jgi:hypothetical protein